METQEIDYAFQTEAHEKQKIADKEELIRTIMEAKLSQDREELERLSEEQLNQEFEAAKAVLDMAGAVQTNQETEVAALRPDVSAEKTEHEPASHERANLPRLSFREPSELKEQMLKIVSEKDAEGWISVGQEEAMLEDGHGISYVRGNIGPEGNLQALQKLKGVLDLMPHNSALGRTFKPGNANEVRKDGIIVFDIDANENAIHSFLAGKLLDGPGKDSQEDEARLKYLATQKTLNKFNALSALRTHLDPESQARVKAEFDDAQKTLEEARTEYLGSAAETQGKSEPKIGPEHIEPEVLDFDKLKPQSSRAERRPSRAENARQGNLTDELKDALGKEYSPFMNEVVRIKARELNKLQALTVKEFMELYSHDQLSQRLQKSYGGLKAYLERALSENLGTESQTIRETIESAAKRLPTPA